MSSNQVESGTVTFLLLRAAPAPVFYTRINPATVNTIHTNRNPNIATSAPKKQINEVSMNSMSLFSFVIGRHPPASHLQARSRAKMRG